MPTLVSAAEARRGGTALSNLYINIGGQSQSTLAGDTVDEKLSTTDQLLLLEEELARDVNPSTTNNLFSAGEMVAFYARAKILRTKSSIYLQKMFTTGQNIDTITIYRADTINGKQTVTEEIVYTNCFITNIKSLAGTDDYENTNVQNPSGLDTFEFKFRYLQRQDTVFFFDQTGQAQGQDVSLINFPQGTLQSS
jgi:type VI protein secretion system component Hcp